MKLNLYFHNEEVALLPETLFDYLTNETFYLNRIDGLSNISDLQDKKLALTFNGKEYPVKITKFVENRRIEFTVFGFDYLIDTMINIVPVESRSELVISSDVQTHSISTYLQFLVRKPFLTKQLNSVIQSL